MTTADVRRLHRLRDLFDAAMDLACDERQAFVAREAGGDADLGRELAELLAAADRHGTPLDEPLLPAMPGDDPGGLVGKRLGPWDVVRLIGRGGMGAVYEAVRADDQYRKRVAIKLVRRGLESAATYARFRRERQILANLDHPGIATLLDGGVAPDGSPYLVMEYVTGKPITTWCDERGLPIEARLELFRQACAAVRYAHLNLVIHRDLKPANILVADDGSVRLLDFGIAKLMDEDGDEAQPITRAGARAFTPGYASPEQLRGQALTTAADVYSLGIVLYELLAGERPWSEAGLASIELEQAILQDVVPPPSAKAAGPAASRRGLRGAARLAARLRGDLDEIALKAIRAEADRRYESADALGDDIARHLAGLPVLARRGAVGYRAGKFLRRHRIGVAAGAAILAVLLGSVVATTTEARRATAAQERSEQVSAFLRELLSSVRPVTGGRDVPVSELLDSASSRLATSLAARPDVRAELELVIGFSYQALGRWSDAERHMRQAIEVRRRLYGPRATSTVIALNALGTVLTGQGLLDAADSVLGEALALRRAAGGGPDTVFASILGNLGSLAHLRGQPAEAERYHREALALRRRLRDSGDNLATSLNNIAVSLGEQNRWAEAEALHREALAMLERAHPDGSPPVADALNALATALDLQQKHEAAESAYVRTLDMRRRLLGPEHPDYAFTLFNFAGFILDRGRYREAADLSRQILALRGGALAESHPAIAAGLQTLGKSLDQLGDPAGAEAALRESLEIRRRYNPAGSWLLASSEGALGEHYTLVRDFARAEALLRRADSTFVATQGEGSPRTVANLRRLVDLYERWGRGAEAARYRERLPR